MVNCDSKWPFAPATILSHILLSNDKIFLRVVLYLFWSAVTHPEYLEHLPSRHSGKEGAGSYNMQMSTEGVVPGQHPRDCPPCPPDRASSFSVVTSRNEGPGMPNTLLRSTAYFMFLVNMIVHLFLDMEQNAHAGSGPTRCELNCPLIASHIGVVTRLTYFDPVYPDHPNGSLTSGPSRSSPYHHTLEPPTFCP